MADCFITRRGGGGIARTPIVTITSETELPADPKPGTIAILTTTPIGHIYAQTAIPESPSVGDLWFFPSAVANVVYIDGKEAYAVKTVRQYNGTTWETVNAFQYIDGAWSTMVYLLNGSDECKPITGGWKAIAIRRASSWTDDETQAPEVEKIDGGILVTQSASGYKSGAYHTAQKIDVSGYDILRIQGEVDIKDRGEVRLVSAVGPYSESNTVLYVELPSSGTMDLTLDVSDLDDEYYVLFDLGTDGSTSTIFTLTKIWLDKVTYLFDNGDQYEAVTGGWEAEKYTIDGTVYGCIGEVIRIGHWPDQYNRIATKKKISFDGYSKLCMEIKDPGGSYTGHWIFLSNGPLGSHNEVVRYRISYSSSKSVYSFDISSVTGEYYVFLMAGNNEWISHQRIWLER